MQPCDDLWPWQISAVMSHFMAGQCGLALTTIDRLGKLLGLRLVSDHNTGD